MIEEMNEKKYEEMNKKLIIEKIKKTLLMNEWMNE